MIKNSRTQILPRDAQQAKDEKDRRCPKLASSAIPSAALAAAPARVLTRCCCGYSTGGGAAGARP